LNHYASPDFWACYRSLPGEVQDLADKCYRLLTGDPHHPSLRLKKVRSYWSARVGLHYRALATEATDGLVWFWIGTHAEYDEIIG
jgi:hypothetical protein